MFGVELIFIYKCSYSSIAYFYNSIWSSISALSAFKQPLYAYFSLGHNEQRKQHSTAVYASWIHWWGLLSTLQGVLLLLVLCKQCVDNCIFYLHACVLIYFITEFTLLPSCSLKISCNFHCSINNPISVFAFLRLYRDCLTPALLC